jgi:hypothetical protein
MRKKSKLIEGGKKTKASRISFPHRISIDIGRELSQIDKLIRLYFLRKKNCALICVFMQKKKNKFNPSESKTHERFSCFVAFSLYILTRYISCLLVVSPIQHTQTHI